MGREGQGEVGGGRSFERVYFFLLRFRSTGPSLFDRV